MSISFKVTDKSPNNYSKPSTIYLRKDTWDDWGFEVTYRAYFKEAQNNPIELGRVKIGKKGLTTTSKIDIPSTFDKLDEAFFSLGETAEYYKMLTTLNDSDRIEVLKALNDIAFNPSLFQQHKEEDSVKTALLRGFSAREVEQELNRLSHNKPRLTPYACTFNLDTENNCIFQFNVSPNSNPPSNIHVLIGRNGAGKTTVLKNISSAFLGLQSINTLNYSIPDDVNLFQKFATLSFVSFSAFDDFEFHEQGQEKKNFRYIGLKNRNGTNKTTEQITEEFCEFIKSCWNNSRGSRWEAILSHLNTDPIIARSEIISNICKNFLNQNECNETALLKIRKDFEKLSSGHKIILLTLTALVFITEQNSLVLFDEPESHLHPPLLSSFIRAVSALMTDRNAVAIMATHSPVVLQEVPKSCVSILTRVGKTQKLELPQIETFGENVGALTREVFKLELNQAGFYQLIEKAAKKEGSLEDLLQTFENQLGSEAKMVAMSAFRHQGNGVKND